MTGEEVANADAFDVIRAVMLRMADRQNGYVTEEAAAKLLGVNKSSVCRWLSRQTGMGAAARKLAGAYLDGRLD